MRVNPNRRNIRNGSGSPFFDGIKRSLRNVMHVHKKDDDWNNFGDSADRRRRNASLLKQLAETNPFVLLMGICLALTVGLGTIIFVMSAIFGSSDSAQSAISNSKSQVRKDNFNPSQATVEMDIDAILQKFKHSGAAMSPQLSHELNKMTSAIVQTHCLNDLPFQLSPVAKGTLEAHVGFIFSELITKDSFTEISVENTVVTDRGTLVDPNKDAQKMGNSKYAKCSLVQALLTKAKQAKIMKKDHLGVEGHFGFTNDEAWDAHKAMFANKDINEAAYELLALAAQNGENNHLARQLIPGIFDQFCPNLNGFFVDGVNEEGIEPWTELMNAVNDLLIQMGMQGNIQLDNNEIPALNKGGQLIAIDKFSLNDQSDDREKYGETYVTCPILDKIVFFHNVPIEKQCQVLIDNIRKDNFYAFENQADMMMLQHCPTTVRALKSQKMEHGDLYHSIFRGELLGFAVSVSNNEFMSEDTENFIVSNDGGIMHEASVGSAFTRCKIVNILAKISGTKSGQYNEEQFNPKEHKSPPKSDDSSKSPEQKLEMDAASIVDYALKNQLGELKQMLTNSLYLYHPVEISKFSADQKEELMAELTQYLITLLNVDFNERLWPEHYCCVLDTANGNLVLVDEGDDKLKEKTMVKSDFITRAFELALQKSTDLRQKASIKPTIERDGNEKGRRNDANAAGNGDDEMNAYLAVLKDDIKSGQNIVDLRKTIKEDLDHWCKGLIDNHLNQGRAERVFWSKLLPMIKKGNIVVNAVVTKNGDIQSKRGNSDEFECTFLQKLLN